MKTRPKSLTARELNRSLALYAAAAPDPDKAARGDASLRRTERARKPPGSVPVSGKGASEASVLSAVLGLLRRHPAVGWVQRMNVASFEADDRYVRCGWVGASDVIGQMRDGRFLAVEVKREHGGRVTEAQVAFLSSVRHWDGVAGVVRSVDEVIELLEKAKR